MSTSVGGDIPSYTPPPQPPPIKEPHLDETSNLVESKRQQKRLPDDFKLSYENIPYADMEHRTVEDLMLGQKRWVERRRDVWRPKTRRRNPFEILVQRLQSRLASFFHPRQLSIHSRNGMQPGERFGFLETFLQFSRTMVVVGRRSQDLINAVNWERYRFYKIIWNFRLSISLRNKRIVQKFLIQPYNGSWTQKILSKFIVNVSSQCFFLSITHK